MSRNQWALGLLITFFIFASPLKAEMTPPMGTSAPITITLTAIPVNDTVMLSWTTNGSFDDFMILRIKGACPTSNLFDNIAMTGSLTFNDSVVEKGTQYCYMVLGDGSNILSNAVQVQTPVFDLFAQAPPSSAEAPTGLNPHMIGD